MSKISNWKEWDGRADAELAALYVEQRLDRDAVAAMMGRSLSSISNRVSRFKMTEREKVQMRRCLGGCERLFPSSWIGHRQCPACYASNAGLMECA
ncbi:hypothetical protein RPD_2154 [Rhodopseudomonas palustris BisB5]|uniref:Uncharacterized protein n=1 Tax=Rhodopseudomonas palustris (strain BisB5) TaxID=316057 RepID=Q138V0_RHOPS|nr:hypothetical protein RPD_2154 [Rhodopseudomonas palustris BisB5]